MPTPKPARHNIRAILARLRRASRGRRRRLSHSPCVQFLPGPARRLISILLDWPASRPRKYPRSAKIEKAGAQATREMRLTVEEEFHAATRDVDTCDDTAAAIIRHAERARHWARDVACSGRHATSFISFISKLRIAAEVTCHAEGNASCLLSLMGDSQAPPPMHSSRSIFRL